MKHSYFISFLHFLSNEIKWMSIELANVLFQFSQFSFNARFSCLFEFIEFTEFLWWIFFALHNFHRFSFWHIVINWFVYHSFTLDLDPLSIFGFELFFRKNKMLYIHCIGRESTSTTTSTIYLCVGHDIQSSIFHSLMITVATNGEAKDFFLREIFFRAETASRMTDNLLKLCSFWATMNTLSSKKTRKKRASKYMKMKLNDRNIKSQQKKNCYHVDTESERCHK